MRMIDWRRSLVLASSSLGSIVCMLVDIWFATRERYEAVSAFSRRSASRCCKPASTNVCAGAGFGVWGLSVWDA